MTLAIPVPPFGRAAQFLVGWWNLAETGAAVRVAVAGAPPSERGGVNHLLSVLPQHPGLLVAPVVVDG